MRTLYLLLELPTHATTEEIRRAKKRLLGLLHPDKHPGLAHADAAFKTVGALVDVLLDPRRRELYDEFGDAGLEADFDPEVARSADRIAASGVTAISLSRVVVDTHEAARGTFVEVEAQRRVACDRCAGHGQVWKACDECSATGRITGSSVIACDGCWGRGWVATPYDLRVCPRCCGARAIRVPHVAPCHACTAGRVLEQCASCRGVGYGFRLVPIRVTVPPGTKHGALLRLVGQLEAGPQDTANDLYVEVLVVAG